MEGIAPFAAAFLLISVMELGDKTQLLVISLSTKHRPLSVAAGAFLGESRIATGYQPLAGIVRAFDLTEIALVEEGELQRAAILGKGPDRRRA